MLKEDMQKLLDEVKKNKLQGFFFSLFSGHKVLFETPLFTLKFFAFPINLTFTESPCQEVPQEDPNGKENQANHIEHPISVNLQETQAKKQNPPQHDGMLYFSTRIEQKEAMLQNDIHHRIHSRIYESIHCRGQCFGADTHQ